MMKEMLEEFEAYLEHLAQGLGHAGRRAGLHGYCTGLVMPLRRKSVEPMAIYLDPLRVSARHQALHHFVAKADWSDGSLMKRVWEWALPALAQHTVGHSGYYWIVAERSFAKKGRHSVGVARQYRGQLRNKENCQVAVSLSLTTLRASLPIACRLYLPREWADDPVRRGKTGVPEELTFATKPEIALTQLRQAVEAKIPAGLVLADIAYGDEPAFLDGVTELGLLYAVEVRPATVVSMPGFMSVSCPMSVKALSVALPGDAYRWVDGQGGNDAAPRSRFAAVRVCPAHWESCHRRAEKWLIIDWPQENSEPLNYYLSTAPADATLEQLAVVTKMRRAIERDYQDLEQKLGFGQYEGRGWRGFHHHATLSIAAHGFLLVRQLRKNSAGASL